MNEPKSGAAAITFLTLYAIYFVFAVFAVTKLGFKTRYSFLVFFAALRIGAQVSATAFSSLGLETASGVNCLIAYLVLGAEGYFTLILCALSFLIKGEFEVYGTSQFKPSKEQANEKYPDSPSKARRMRFLSFAATFHWVLIPANILIIVGGSKMTSITTKAGNHGEEMRQAKGLRGAGQGIFLAETVVLFLLALYLFFWRNVRGYKVKAVIVARPFLLVRGIFGVISVFVDKFNYYDFDNYTAAGLKPSFLCGEYIMGATMEFVSATLLLSTFYVHYRSELKKNRDVESQAALTTNSQTSIELENINRVGKHENC